MSRKIGLELAAVVALVLATNLPFLDKAVYQDGHVILTIAKGLRTDPAHPYSGKIIVGIEYPIKFYLNPPLYNYFLALTAWIWGDFADVPMHAACLVFPLLAAVSSYLIVRRFTRHPLLCALLICSAPAFIIQSNNLMTDMCALSLSLTAFYAFLRGCEAQNSGVGWLVAAGLLGGASVLSRFSALTLLPVLFVYCVAYRRPWVRAWVTAAVFLLPLIAWELLFYRTHGQLHPVLPGLFSTMPMFPVEFRLAGNFTALGAGFIFAPSGLLLFLVHKGLCRYLALAVVAPVVLITPQVPVVHFDNLTPDTKLLMFLLAWVGCAVFLAVVVRTVQESWRYVRGREFNANELFLGWFLLVNFIGVTVFLQFSTPRYLLAAGLPLALFFLARADEISWKPPIRKAFVWTTVLLTLGLGMTLAWKDYIVTGKLRAFAVEADKRLSKIKSAKKWFVAECGLRWYLERTSHLTYCGKNDRPSPGHILLLPTNAAYEPINMSRWYDTGIRFRIPSAGPPVRLVDFESGAGFYSNGYAPLPFTFRDNRIDEFRVYRYGIKRKAKAQK